MWKAATIKKILKRNSNLCFQQKEPSGGIVLEEPMALQHWRGPRAHSNRYEGWDRDSNQQVTLGSFTYSLSRQGCDLYAFSY